MKYDDAIALLRLTSAATSFILLMVLAASASRRWSHLRPSQRLFVLGFGLYAIHAMAVTFVAMDSQEGPTAITAILPIANLWLIGAVVALSREPTGGRHER